MADRLTRRHSYNCRPVVNQTLCRHLQNYFLEKETSCHQQYFVENSTYLSMSFLEKITHYTTTSTPLRLLNCRLCAIFNLKTFLSFYQQDAAKRQTAGIVFTHRPKIRFFAPQGRLVAPIRVKLCRTNGHLGPLGCAKFHVYRCRGVGIRPPKYQKFPLFGKESPRRGDSLDRFRKILEAFIRLTIYVSVSNFM